MQVPKFGGTHHKIEPHGKLRSIFYNFRFWSRISPEWGNIIIQNQKPLQTRAIPPAFDEKSPVNFGPITVITCEFESTKMNFFGRLNFRPSVVLRPVFLRTLQIDQALLAHNQMGTGVPQKILIVKI